MELTAEQCELDDEQLYELVTDWDNPDGREALENGCVGWGPYSDQNAVVWTGEIGSETVVGVVDVEDAISNNKIHYEDKYLPDGTEGKHVFAVNKRRVATPVSSDCLLIKFA